MFSDDPRCDELILKVSIFIIGWDGFNARALDIASGLAEDFDDIVVVTSGKESVSERFLKLPPQASSRIRRLHVSDECMYGCKLAECLDMFSRELFFLINADARCQNWSDSVRSAIDCFAHFEKVAIWAPRIDFTPWYVDRVENCKLNEQYSVVLQTDGIVFCWTREIVSEIKLLDIRGNNHGWEIDSTSVSMAQRMGKLAVIDRECLVTHPRVTRYSSDTADRERMEFLHSLPTHLYQDYLRLQFFIRARDRELGDPQVVSLYKALSGLSETALRQYIRLTSGEPKQIQSYFLELTIIEGVYSKLDDLDERINCARSLGGRCFIYGTGGHTSLLLCIHPALYKYVDAFLNTLGSSSYLEKPCYHPDKIDFYPNDIVILSSYASCASMRESLASKNVQVFSFHTKSQP